MEGDQERLSEDLRILKIVSEFIQLRFSRFLQLLQRMITPGRSGRKL